MMIAVWKNMSQLISIDHHVQAKQCRGWGLHRWTTIIPADSCTQQRKPPNILRENCPKEHVILQALHRALSYTDRQSGRQHHQPFRKLCMYAARECVLLLCRERERERACFLSHRPYMIRTEWRFYLVISLFFLNYGTNAFLTHFFASARCYLIRYDNGMPSKTGILFFFEFSTVSQYFFSRDWTFYRTVICSLDMEQ
jgi:hypothetical protein